MADALTTQNMQDGKLDIKSLGEAANGDENTTVTTRTGQTYPSAARAISIMFRNGGLPAEPFETLASMETNGTSLADGQLAMVYNETVNNGLYVKTAGAWVKAKYDPETNARGYVDSALDSELRPYLLALTNSEFSFVALDKDKNILFKVDKEGDFYTNNQNKPVQWFMQTAQENKRKTDSIIFDSNDNNPLIIKDASGNILLRFNTFGEFFINGFSDPLQSLVKLRASKSKSNDSADTHKYNKSLDVNGRLRLKQSYVDTLLDSKFTYSNVSPIPNFMAPQDFSIGTAWVDKVSMTALLPSDHVVISGFDPSFREDIGVVHPQVWSFREQVSGYKYWLAINPYTNGNEAIELPFIYGSNSEDLKKWELIPNFPQPFEVDPVTKDGSKRGHLSDSGFTYDPTSGDLVYFWRETLYYSEDGRSDGKSSIRASRFDGVAWSKVFELHEQVGMDLDYFLSPNITFNSDEKLFYLYSVTGGEVYYRTSSSLSSGSWSEKVKCGFTGGSEGFAWHIDVKLVGNKVVMLIHVDQAMSNPNGVDGFYFATSSDFKNFTGSTNSIVTSGDLNLYKATFEPILNADGTAQFKIIYTSDAKTEPQYQLYVTNTNTIDLGE